jgi:PTH2 family peptidyl-tRNA hydrolase
MAQIAHAATMSAATGTLEGWVDAGCPGRVIVPERQQTFDELSASPGLSAKVEDAGLTEVPPGTITVLAIAPGALCHPQNSRTSATDRPAGR